MTQQIEQELTALFHDAAARLEIQPAGDRRTRGGRMNSMLAAALAVAVVAALAVVAVRLGSDADGRSLAPAGASAEDRLAEAMVRTFSQPLRLVTRSTTSSTTTPVGPQPGDVATAVGPDTVMVVEVDPTAQEGLLRQDGHPKMLAADGHLYAWIEESERQMYRIPASALWYEVPVGSSPVTASMLGMAGVPPVEQLRTALAGSEMSVRAVDDDQIVVIGRESPDGEGNDFSPTTVRTTFHLTTAGLVDLVRVHVEFESTPGSGLDQEIRVEPLTNGLTLTAPDPDTVVSARQWQIMQSRPTHPGSSCSTTRSGDGSVTTCGQSTGTVIFPKMHRKGHATGVSVPKMRIKR